MRPSDFSSQKSLALLKAGIIFCCAMGRYYGKRKLVRSKRFQLNVCHVIIKSNQYIHTNVIKYFVYGY